MLLPLGADETGRGKVEAWFERGAEPHARREVLFGSVGEQTDGARLGRDGDDELVLHHESGFLGGLQVDADQNIVEALTQHARQVLVVDGVQQLGLVQVAAEGVGHAGVAQSAQGTVELQGVVVEHPHVLLLRQLHHVHTPWEGKKKVF